MLDLFELDYVMPGLVQIKGSGLFSLFYVTYSWFDLVWVMLGLVKLVWVMPCYVIVGKVGLGWVRLAKLSWI